LFFCWGPDVLFWGKIKYSKNCGGFLRGLFCARHRGIRFCFANAMAAFLVGPRRGFKHVRDGVFDGFDFACIFIAERQNAEM
jgi:hypothetical protein